MRTKIFTFLCAVLGCAQAFSQGTGSASSTGKGGNSLKNEAMVCLDTYKVLGLCKKKCYNYTFQARSLSSNCDKIIIETSWNYFDPLTGEEEWVNDKKTYKVEGNDWQSFSASLCPNRDADTEINFSVFAPVMKSFFEIRDVELKEISTDTLSISDFGDNTEGSLYGLTCSLKGISAYFSGSLNFIWFKNSVDTDDAEGWTKVGTGEKLTFDHLSPADEGFYRVLETKAGMEESITPCSTMSESFKVAINHCGACDSTYTTLYTDTTCEGQKYTGYGFTVNSANRGTTPHQQNELTVCGCDSIIILQLTGLPTTTTTQLFWIENGDSVTYGSELYKKPGIYYQNRVTDSACENHTIVVKKKQIETPCDSINIVPDKVLVLGGNSLGRWHIAGIENFPHTKVAIYSRSGRLLWEGMAYTDETGWDGTYQGNSLPSTDYWYVISSEECDRVLSGHLTLLNSGNR